MLVIPGPQPGRSRTEQGLVITVPGWRVPATGGYRAILTRRPLQRLLDQLYCETGLVSSYSQVLRHLHAAGQ